MLRYLVDYACEFVGTALMLCYVVGPPLGALLAVSAWKGRWGSRRSFICAKLYQGHEPDRIFACSCWRRSARRSMIQNTPSRSSANSRAGCVTPTSGC